MLRLHKHPVRSVFLTLLLVSGIHGWGLRGHRIAARIAENHLNSGVRKQVRDLLGGESLPRVANEADHLRSDKRWACASVFHYASVEDGEIYLTSAKNPQGDIVRAILYFENLLRTKETPPEKKAMALKWLVHLVADLHQPLHIGRSCDRGGNSVAVEWFGKKSNLHKVWDSEFINDEELSYTEFADFLDKENAMQSTTLQQGSFADWADEAPIVRAELYTCQGKDGCCPGGTAQCSDEPLSFGKCEAEEGFTAKLGYAYTEKHRRLLERQLYRAGIRLAGVINRALGGVTPGADEQKLIHDLKKQNAAKSDPIGACVERAVGAR